MVSDYTPQYRHVCGTIIIIIGDHLNILTTQGVNTSSTAQGGGGSFKLGNLEERLVVVNQGWQSEATDGSIYLSIYLSIFIYLSIYLSIHLSTLASLLLS